jgi:hypothetical protein
MSKAKLLHIQLGKLKEILTLLIVPGKIQERKKGEITSFNIHCVFLNLDQC